MGAEGLHSVGVTPPFPGTLAGYFLTRPELLRPSISRRRWIIWRRWWIDRRCLQAVQLLSVQLSGDVAAARLTRVSRLRCIAGDRRISWRRRRIVRIVGLSIIAIVVGWCSREGPERRSYDRRGGADEGARHTERPEQRKWRTRRIVLRLGGRDWQSGKRGSERGRDCNSADTHEGPPVKPARPRIWHAKREKPTRSRGPRPAPVAYMTRGVGKATGG